MRGTAASEARADPGKVIATELAFARLAQEKGQWTAFAATASADAVMFVPQATNARKWLRGRANPPTAVKWQPAQVWVSCDGSLAVTKGPWQRPAGVGYFTTVWARQRDGSYKWVLDQGDTLAQPLAVPEMIPGKVAQCPAGLGRGRRGPKVELARATVTPPTCSGSQCNGGGSSADGTLTYAYQTTERGRRFTVQMNDGGALGEVLRSDVAAE